ncbi:alpha-amylase [Dinghuibacter silviterrae]|uniref:Alpha-amylase n=1 Tax=Dinghuibacter silviterrae TaxID=1539049 RepID=A0A4R8DSM9_9BACT|nr:alpha-amylase [Dinghuibacter silviterrae]TDX01069.1 alpha-amylase [Dinghuibacter silviterrae]
MANNITLMQFFHWYYPADGSLWNWLTYEAHHLEKVGINGVWLPPAYKGLSAHDVGYAPYDLYDLGEFDQKGTIRTKYGTRKEYLEAVKTARRHHILVLADVVFNHKAGADEKERIPVRKVNPENRNEFISERYDIDAYTRFTFPGRKGKYSKFIWDWHCFSGLDRAEDTGEEAIFSIQNEYGELWEEMIDDELGNYDYLMFDDIETRNPSVREELKKWGKWYMETAGLDGFRLDAVKHVNADFLREWAERMRAVSSKPLLIIGEYWQTASKDPLVAFIEKTRRSIQLFDAVLHMNFHQASRQGETYDLRTIFDGSLVQHDPFMAITLVDNHDTQPLQALESPVDFWFKPHAYAMILLREQGIPCIFYPAFYGAKYKDKGGDGGEHEINLAPVEELKTLLPLRRHKAYGFQRDYLDHPNTIGWTREGDNEHPGSGLAVLLSNGAEGFKPMEMGTRHSGRPFRDALGHRSEVITVDEHGWAQFLCNAGSVSVWVPV